MSKPNYLSSFGRRRNGPPLTPSQALQYQRIRKEGAKREKDNAAINYKKTGTGKFIKYGTRARLKGIPFYIPTDMTDEGDKISYHHGYYERGNSTLAILIEYGCCDIDGVVITPEEFKKYLTRIAVNDGMNPDVQFKALPKVAKYSAIYAKGYLSVCDE